MDIFSQTSYPLQLFYKFEPLEFVAIENLVLLPESRYGIQYFLFVTDRFTKLVQMVPLKRVRAVNFSQAFFKTLDVQVKSVKDTSLTMDYSLDQNCFGAHISCSRLLMCPRLRTTHRPMYR